ncbi:MAG: methyltransferase domain-containing protein [Bacteroidetes bacterium]|nr:methyltransferase domain-containing protein [Bacteroidota bacterium]
MFESLLDVIRCPLTREKLSLSVISRKKKLFLGNEEDIIWEGILLGGDGSMYPIINGIPRMLIEACVDYEFFLKTHLPDYTARKIKLLSQHWLLLDNVIRNNSHNKKSFSKEWGLFKYNSDKTWNLDSENMLQQFLDETNETKESIKNKFIFDAGCGNGQLNISLAEAGVRSIAMDISDSIVRAFNYNTNPNVSFIQGDVFHPPVEAGRFDVVYCSGVLVATHDPKLGFSCIESCVKTGGKLSVWMYHPRKNFIHNMFNLVRKFSSLLPFRFQYYLYSATLLPLSYLIKKIKGTKQNAREMMIEILDWFSPKYRWEFEPAVLLKWYEKKKYENILITTRNVFGFSIIGTKINS